MFRILSSTDSFMIFFHLEISFFVVPFPSVNCVEQNPASAGFLFGQCIIYYKPIASL